MTRRTAKTTRPGGRRRIAMWGGAVLAVAVLLVAGALAFTGDDSEEPPSDASATRTDAPVAPDFELESIAGETVSLSDYRGRPVALVFMHTY